MTHLQMTMLFISGFCARWSQETRRSGGLTTTWATIRSRAPLKHINYLEDGLGVISGAEDRGPHWYEYITDVESDSKSSLSSSSSFNAEDSVSKGHPSSWEASSRSSEERDKRYRAYRECTPCPSDMVLKHTNRGIKWICGMYQRAHRSFKSICMMRYRNCQDGTMFVKIANNRCANDTYHGRHWFYVYRV